MTPRGVLHHHGLTAPLPISLLGRVSPIFLVTNVPLLPLSWMACCRQVWGCVLRSRRGGLSPPDASVSPGQCPSPGQSWPLSLQDSQLCCRHLGWRPEPRARQAGQVGTPAGKVRPGEGEAWLGCSGACGQGQQLRETGFSSERGGGGGCRWGVGGISPPSDLRPCLVPGLPPGCEAWYGGSQEDSRPQVL